MVIGPFGEGIRIIILYINAGKMVKKRLLNKLDIGANVGLKLTIKLKEKNMGKDAPN